LFSIISINTRGHSPLISKQGDAAFLSGHLGKIRRHDLGCRAIDARQDGKEEQHAEAHSIAFCHRFIERSTRPSGKISESFLNP
jgi:hypothetical protein